MKCPYCGEELEEAGGRYRCRNVECKLYSEIYEELDTLRDIADHTKKMSEGRKGSGKIHGIGRFASRRAVTEMVNDAVLLWLQKMLDPLKCPNPDCRMTYVLTLNLAEDAPFVRISLGRKARFELRIPREYICKNCKERGNLEEALGAKVFDLAKRYAWEVLGEVIRGMKKEKGPKRIGGTSPSEAQGYYVERYLKWTARGIGRVGRFAFDKGREKWLKYREKRRLAKEGRGEIGGGKEKEGRVKKFAKSVWKVPFKAAKETARFPFRMAGKRILKMRAPRPKKESRIESAILPLVLLIIGATISAAIGNLFFMFAFLCWVGYSLLPQPSDPVQKIIEKVEAKYANELEDLYKKLNTESDPKNREVIQKQIDNVEKRINREIEFRVGNPWGLLKQTITSGRIAAKETFRWGAFALLSLAFLTSNFPLAKPVGLVLAFVFYFMIGGER